MFRKRRFLNSVAVAAFAVRSVWSTELFTSQSRMSVLPKIHLLAQAGMSFTLMLLVSKNFCLACFDILPPSCRVLGPRSRTGSTPSWSRMKPFGFVVQP